jgi:translocator protein
LRPRPLSLSPDQGFLSLMQKSLSCVRLHAWQWAFVTIPLLEVLGMLSGRASASGDKNAWFKTLVRPKLMPPGAVFGIVWTILYGVLGYVLAVLIETRSSPARNNALALFLLQLVFNYAWSPIFFGAHKVKLALYVIVAIFSLTLGSFYYIGRFNNTAAMLLVPYLGWLSFASYLNYEFGRLNNLL